MRTALPSSLKTLLSALSLSSLGKRLTSLGPRLNAANPNPVSTQSAGAQQYVAGGCETLLRGLFDGAVDADAVAAACSSDVEWDDLTASKPLVGREAVRDLINAKFPYSSLLAVERISDGKRSGGFTWHREVRAATPDGQKSKMGLRGTLFAEMDADGKIAYVREASEPIFKAGAATEALLKAVTKDAKREPKPAPTFTPRTPTTASGVAQYLWEDAYPGGADPTEALRLFSENIVYEDFNYATPFVGKAEVAEFVQAFDIPGIEFVPLKISEGERACVFTWKVKVNGQDGPSGISFYEIDDDGKVCFIRDIPAPSPQGFRPLGSLAAVTDPELRLLSAEKLLRSVLGVASLGMGLLRPIFAAEAAWQAEVLGDEQTRIAAIKQLDAESTSAPLVVYTYILSPFSTEAIAFLDETGCHYKKYELGLEWFLLGKAGSALRAELLIRTGQSSLPHIFIGGKSIGGLYSGTPGLIELKKQGKLTPMLAEAGALN
eukprot:CAMPEP_0119304842 /NCGR_PEP_ID=MMETSP1333-20130426/5969_1 /TAXON_ID=418940 /ORGANISM="Scyphosphaera apsteinii, Strain RCC1455" /LENGTH=490 /DNA_ID=CAMNT_0007307791 /DNA_START=102 /DNA_END=1574 /DNA_ORIENTATION=-